MNKFLPIILVLGVIVAVSGCTQTGAGTGNLVLKITDKPALNIEKAEVTISQIQIHKAAFEGEDNGNGDDNQTGNETNESVSLEAQGNGQGSGNDNNDGTGNGVDNANEPEGAGADWITIVEGPVTYDLVALIDVYELLGEAVLEAGKYTQIRLTVDSALVTIDGTEHDLTIPSGTIKLVKAFMIEEGATTTLTLDFDAQESIHATGSDKYIMKPTIKILSETEVNEQDDEISLEQKCTESGGTVTTTLCCEETTDFPNLCLVGACGCAPENSEEINTCDCGEGKCFDGEVCVNQEAV